MRDVVVTGLGRTGELRTSDDRDIEVSGKLLERTRDVADLLDAVLVAGPGLHELKIVDDHEIEAPAFALELARLRSHLGHG